MRLPPFPLARLEMAFCDGPPGEAAGASGDAPADEASPAYALAAQQLDTAPLAADVEAAQEAGEAVVDAPKGFAAVASAASAADDARPATPSTASVSEPGAQL